MKANISGVQPLLRLGKGSYLYSDSLEQVEVRKDNSNLTNIRSDRAKINGIKSPSIDTKQNFVLVSTENEFIKGIGLPYNENNLANYEVETPINPIIIDITSDNLILSNKVTFIVGNLEETGSEKQTFDIYLAVDDLNSFITFLKEKLLDIGYNYTIEYLTESNQLKITYDSDKNAIFSVKIDQLLPLYITTNNNKEIIFTDNQGQENININSPHFTGIPTAPTAPKGTSSTQLATTEFVLENSSSGGGSLSTLSDVSLSTLENGQTITYNSTNEKWENNPIIAATIKYW